MASSNPQKLSQPRLPVDRRTSLELIATMRPGASRERDRRIKKSSETERRPIKFL
jgi:hypothetical protein